MIFSSIYREEEIKWYPKAIRKAVDYLKSHDFTNMEPGVYEILGKEMYAQVFDTVTGPVEERRPESHENYLDVQFLAAGEESLGVTANTGNYQVAEHKKERDLIFYKEVENESFLNAKPGCFCVFFPEDIHRPAVFTKKPETIRKVVVKVKTTLL